MAQDLRKFRVFVVDDEAVITSTMGMILRHHGYDTHSFELPLEALSASHAMTPDLLITDVMMPLLSGIELAIQMREHCPNCKVILFSGQPATSQMLETARAKGHEFDALPKPVHPTELLAKIRTVMDA
jgi:DNA-binding response OmpR family regulator